VRIRLRDSPMKKTDTADRQNTAGEGITKKNLGAGIQDTNYLSRYQDTCDNILTYQIYKKLLLHVL
jgi:hypothetical protein